MRQEKMAVSQVRRVEIKSKNSVEMLTQGNVRVHFHIFSRFNRVGLRENRREQITCRIIIILSDINVQIDNYRD